MDLVIAIRFPSERIRKSRYSQAFVQSFARTTLPNQPDQASTNMTINKHHAFMTQQIARIIAPGHIPDPDQYSTTPSITWEDLVLNVILNNMINVVYDPAVAHRRRCLEWPTSGSEDEPRRVYKHLALRLGYH